MMNVIRKQSKIVRFLFLIIFFLNIFCNKSFGMPGGPSQPESTGFSPVEYTEMVNKFNGKFSYNIPLMDVGGYPINLVYDANVTNEMEASWVGLGWTLNTGSINRTKRGLPDDFNGDKIIREINHKPIKSWGVDAGPYIQVANFLDKAKFLKDKLKLKGSLSLSAGVSYNNRYGWSAQASVGKGISLAANIGGSLTMGLGYNDQTTSSSSGGVTKSTNLNMSLGHKFSKDNFKMNNSIGVGFGDVVNSRQGQLSNSWGVNLNNSLSQTIDKTTVGINFRSGVNFTHSFIDPTYIPQISVPYKIITKTGDLKGGGDVWMFDIGGNISGYSTEQVIARNVIINKSYGYFNSDKATIDPDGLMDFNREKDIPYHPNVPNIAIPNYTYDLFTLNQHKNGGQFRAYRQDFGLLRDPQGYTEQEAYKVGLEGHGGAYFEVGLTLENTSTESKSGSGYENSLENLLSVDKVKGKEVFEPFYFGKSDEWIKTDQAFINRVNGFEACNIALNDDLTRSTFFKKKKDVYTNFGDRKLLKNEEINNLPTDERSDNRMTYISYFNHKERKQIGFEKGIYSYDQNILNPSNLIDNYKDISHHISEFTVKNPDGDKFVYGIPVYNLKQEDYSFSISPQNSIKDAFGLCSYSNNEMSFANNSGKDGYFNKEITPKYAHSWLLTSYLSKDYIDITGDGITDDDMGTGVKFRYKKGENFSWRNPVHSSLAPNKATYNYGVEYLDDDNKGVVTFGEREEWYNHSIESKTHIAFFVTENRQDCLPIRLDGTLGVGNKQKLKKIILFSKADVAFLVRNNPNISVNQIIASATPIKTIEFLYQTNPSLILCKNTPNSNEVSKGKLTLAGIKITHGTNKTGLTYKFDYGNSIEDNPDYNPKKIDRWGTYKSNNKLFGQNELDGDQYTYTVQNKQDADKNVRAWLLKKIDLPSGGSIEVNYESHDYSYVQDKRASKMYKIIGFGSKKDAALYNDELYKDMDGNNYVFIETQLNGSNYSDEDIRRMFWEDMNDIQTSRQMYYKARVRLDDKKYETIPGYFEVESIGKHPISSNGKLVIWVKAKPYDANFNPIVSNSWQFIRDNLSNLAWDGSLGEDASFFDILGSIMSNMKKVFTGEEEFTVQATRRGLAQKAKLDGSSIVRAFIPDMTKIGGGNRVSQIKIKDNWDLLTGTQNVQNEYTVKYEYTTKDKNGKPISSGVAQYEPQMGGEENSWRQPINFKGQIGPGGPVSIYNIEKPFGETMFPMAEVGYSSVKITKNGSENKGDGFSIFDFYTSYNFPVKSFITDIETKRDNPASFTIFNYTSSSDEMSVSQGYSLILNDMNGKPKNERVYKFGQNENHPPMKSLTYYYKNSQDVPILNNNGSIMNTNIGTQVDAYADIREMTTDVTLKNWSPGGGTLPAAGIPAPWINPLDFGYMSDVKGVKTISVNKVISQSYVLEKKEANNDGAKINTENLVWDNLSSQVLLTSSDNDFGKKIYNLNLPAHKSIPNLGLASQNENTNFIIYKTSGTNNKVVFNATTKSVDNNSKFLRNGDEVYIECVKGSNITSSKICHYIEGVSKLIPNSNPVTYELKNYFIDREGNIYEPDMTADIINARILSSSYKNQPNLPLLEVTTLNEDPRSQNTLKTTLNSVIGGQAYEYKDNWKMIENDMCSSSSNYNPFVKGIINNWKHLKSYDLYGNRKFASTNIIDIDLTKDGTLNTNPTGSNVSLFYAPNSNSFLKNNSTSWYSNKENILYDIKGNLVEDVSKVTKYIKGTIDPSCYECGIQDRCEVEEIYSASKFGFDNNLPTVVGQNTKYNELDFCSFEENGFNLSYDNNVKSNYYGIIPNTIYDGNSIISKVINTDGHTGGKSLFLYKTYFTFPIKNCNIENMSNPLFIIDNKKIKGNKEKNSSNNFNFVGGKKYKLEFWVKSTESFGKISQNIVEMVFYNSSQAIVSQANNAILKTNKIEGWQLVELSFDVPKGFESAEMKFSSGGPTEIRLIDDIKISPSDAQSKSYVYDPKSLKLISELDENHFATFYDYDEAGNLIRVRKETEKGIVTIKESNIFYQTKK